ncbi:rod shape-determining protein MreC [Vulgatibacter sp.]|uniref:rod shape-determining protein MreC n=1 Tax=Vulgatibacter sp. TaxID=1971226 RepID=UPI00356A7D15
MLAFFQRYRELLLVAALLVLPAGTYVANAKQGRDLSALDKFCLALSAPVSRVVDGVLGGATALWSDYVALRGVHEENERLRQEVADLRSALNEGREAELENQRLHDLLGFARGDTGRLLAAPVIGVSPTHRRTITISKGAFAGIAEGMAVVTSEGVVGKVVATYGDTAEVQLLVDAASAVAARVQRSRARVTVRGNGSEGALQLANALRTDDIEEGDLLVTSGTDRVFPKGLIVGRIGRIDRKPYGMYQEGEVLPAVDVSGLEEVLVVVEAGVPAVEELPNAFLEEAGPLPVVPGTP